MTGQKNVAAGQKKDWAVRKLWNPFASCFESRLKKDFTRESRAVPRCWEERTPFLFAKKIREEGKTSLTASGIGAQKSGRPRKSWVDAGVAHRVLRETVYGKASCAGTDDQLRKFHSGSITRRTGLGLTGGNPSQGKVAAKSGDKRRRKREASNADPIRAVRKGNQPGEKRPRTGTGGKLSC